MSGQKVQPMAGYRALDLSDDKGFLCGKLLADLGVDVIKVEPPRGDPSRRNAPFYHAIPDEEKSLYWFAYNSGKRGVTLDIGVPTGKHILKELVRTADFLIESFPPGYLEGMGLDYTSLCEINPRVIAVSIRLFGDFGPYRDYSASDFTMMACGSLVFSTGDPDRPPVSISTQQAFPLAGAQAAAGAMIAHHHRQLTNRGQQVNVTVQDSVSLFLPAHRYLWEFLGQVAPRNSRLRMGHGVYFTVIWPCEDGQVAARISIGGSTYSRRMYGLVRALNDEGIAGDLVDVKWEEEDVMSLTQAKADHWEAQIGNFFLRHTKAELLKMAQDYQFMFLLPVNTCADIMEDQQLAARDFFVKLSHPDLADDIVYPGSFFRSNAVGIGPKFRAPLIGEHNREVYRELGYSDEQLIALKQGNVI